MGCAFAGFFARISRTVLVASNRPGLCDTALQQRSGSSTDRSELGFIVNLENYFPVLLFILVGIGVGVLPQLLGRLLGPHRPDAAKLSPYECGFEAFEDARMKFDVRYYLVAILFILFDLETAFFFPWGVSMRELGWAGFVTMMVFIAEFVVGFWYIWKKGALDWE
jgi:NADH-quinone oxidoreductase subunit A